MAVPGLARRISRLRDLLASIHAGLERLAAEFVRELAQDALTVRERLARLASRAFSARKRREGKRHHQAVLALARRHVDVLHTILPTGEPYRADHVRAA